MSYLNDHLTEAKPRKMKAEQGSDEWQNIRFDHGAASETSAVINCNLYGVTRTDVLDQKKLRILSEPTPAEQFIFDRGHRAEELARPKVEQMLGDDLYRSTLARYIDGVPLLASYDGITMMRDITWENKLRNKDLTSVIESGDIKNLHKHYRAQMEHQLMVSGADRAYFTINDDNEASEPVGLWYESDAELRAEIIAAWRQFFIDLETHVVREKTVKLEAEPVKSLPTLFVQAKGEITATNLPDFVTAANEFLANINKAPKTDQEFANAKDLAKKMREAAKAIEAQVESMLAQSASLADAKRTMDDLAIRFNKDALALEKAVDAEEANRKARMLTEAQDKLSAYIVQLDERIGRAMMPQVIGQFAAAIKGKRSIDSMAAAIDAELAARKIEASAIADRIIANLRTMGNNEHLFPDLRAVCVKPAEDFAALLAKRQADAEAATKARLAAQEAIDNTKASMADQAAPSTVVEMPAAKVKEVTHQAIIDHEADIRAFLDLRNPPEKLRGTIRAYLVAYEEWKAERSLKQAA